MAYFYKSNVITIADETYQNLQRKSNHVDRNFGPQYQRNTDIAVFSFFYLWMFLLTNSDQIGGNRLSFNSVSVTPFVNLLWSMTCIKNTPYFPSHLQENNLNGNVIYLQSYLYLTLSRLYLRPTSWLLPDTWKNYPTGFVSFCNKTKIYCQFLLLCAIMNANNNDSDGILEFKKCNWIVHDKCQ